MLGPSLVLAEVSTAALPSPASLVPPRKGKREKVGGRLTAHFFPEWTTQGSGVTQAQLSQGLTVGGAAEPKDT
jgi:hypothetical protein